MDGGTRNWLWWPALLLMGALSPCGHLNENGRFGTGEPATVGFNVVPGRRRVLVGECLRCRATFLIPRDCHEDYEP
jgi:hypothetical protein